jgi:hypothetical protein
MALISPRTIPGFYVPPGSPEPYKTGMVAKEGELAAVLHMTLELSTT